ncbi:hypothetical protein MTO96_044660 [Rhipicephalus appendiculatus]
MDTAKAPPRCGAAKRHALDSSREGETVGLLSELKKAISDTKSSLFQVQEVIAHPQLGPVALSERVLKLEGTSQEFSPSTSTAPVPSLQCHCATNGGCHPAGGPLKIDPKAQRWITKLTS